MFNMHTGEFACLYSVTVFKGVRQSVVLLYCRENAIPSRPNCTPDAASQ